jgi:hypothetical protein
MDAQQATIGWWPGDPNYGQAAFTPTRIRPRMGFRTPTWPLRPRAGTQARRVRARLGRDPREPRSTCARARVRALSVPLRLRAVRMRSRPLPQSPRVWRPRRVRRPAQPAGSSLRDSSVAARHESGRDRLSLLPCGTALVPTDTPDGCRSSRKADASDDPNTRRHIDALNLSAGGRKVAGSSQSPRLSETAAPAAISRWGRRWHDPAREVQVGPIPAARLAAGDRSGC